MDKVFAFGPFQLFPVGRILLEDNRQVRLGGRALDILIDLVEHAATVVSKDELMARVWSDVTVEEGSVRVHVAALRRALGDGRAGRRYIVNVPGRGYSFVAPLVTPSEEAPPVKRPPAVERRHDLPVVLTRMIGRAEIVEAIIADLPRLRFITLVGPGGIGKTRVALAVADAVAMRYPDGVRFIDLSSIADAQLVPGTLATAFGLVTATHDPLASLVAFLRDKAMLIVLDSSEHVLEGTAAFTEQVIRFGPNVHILATSREPLRAEGEQVRRLPALALAPPAAQVSARDAFDFSAIELFAERASANLDSFQITDADAPIVAHICRRLDGIPLAIELVAGRIDSFGISGLAALLDERLSLVTTGKRTAVPRHRTMSAALEWSYKWLPEAEQAMLRQLAVFVGPFGLEAAQSVQAGPRMLAVEHLANLVDKSLIVADIGGPNVTYRLLDTTRAYGLEKLRECGELEAAARRHADYYLAAFRNAETDLSLLPMPQWLDRYAGHLDNLRAAVVWAFSPKGDVQLGIALTIAGAPLWFQLSLADECRRRFERALSHLERPDADPSQRMRLLALRSCVVSVTTMADGRNPLSVVLELADALGDDDHRAMALWALWATHSIRGEKQQMMVCADRFRETAEATQDNGYLKMSDRMFASTLLQQGDLRRAREHLDKALARPDLSPGRAQLIHRHMEQYVMDRSAQTVLMFVQGTPDQAMRNEERNYAHALSTGHALSQVNLLRQSACLVSLYIGDLPNAELFVGRLLELSGRHELGVSVAMGQCFEAMLTNLRGGTASIPAFRAAVEKFRATGFSPFFPLILSNFAETLCKAGHLDEGLATIEEALARADALGHLWPQAELLRVKAKLVLGSGDSTEAGRLLQQALDLAHTQGALAWELRVATDLAELRQAEGCAAEGRELLSAVYGRFTEGFQRPDLLRAQGLLKSCGRRQSPAKRPA
jgi:predicted ATPase/DNA-binding winged helix-turn-helix (wHTH) protein